MAIDWYAQNIDYVVHELNTDLEHGLSAAEVASRLHQYGYNQIRPPKRPAWIRWLLFQLNCFSTVFVAVTSALLLLLFKATGTAMLAAGLCIAQIVFRHLQYRRIERIRQLLAGYPAYRAHVLRNGSVINVDAREIVPGDVLLLQSGDRVPADARLVESLHLSVDESFITGMNEPVNKQASILSTREVPINEQQNMVFAGTFVVRGEGRAIAVATGAETELHRTYTLLGLEDDFSSESLFHLSYLERLGLTVGVALAAIIAVAAWFTQDPPSFQSAFELGMGFAVAAVPGGLTALAMSILAFNIGRILQMDAVVRRFNGMESLASISAVCVEHIGGFAHAEMQVQCLWVDSRVIPKEQFPQCFEALSREEMEEPPPEEETEPFEVPVDLPLLMIVSSLSADTLHAEKLAAPFDESTDQAITEAAAEIGISKEEYRSILMRVRELPRDEQRWRRTLFRNTRNQVFLFVIGDLDVVLDNSLYIQENGKAQTLRDDQRRAILIANHTFSEKNSRVLAVAFRRLTPEEQGEELEASKIVSNKLTFLGLIGLNAPLYEGTAEVLQEAQDSGLKVVMMIDEDAQSATKIAQEIGLLQNHQQLLTREEFDTLDREQRAERLSRTLVYSELTPEQRVEVVQYLQQQGLSVAFVGNRPEHVPALKSADVAVCTAEHTSDIALEASDLVLHEGGITRLIPVLAQARQGWLSIRNSVRWLLSCQVGMGLTLGLAFLFHLYRPHFVMPLTLLQVLWISLVVTVIPILAISRDTTVSLPLSYVRARPIGQFFGKGYQLDIFLRGLVIALMALVSFAFTIDLYETSSDVFLRARTVATTVLVFTQLLFIFQCHRRLQEPIGYRLLANRALLTTLGAVGILQILLIYVPGIQGPFGFAPLGWKEWLFIAGFGIVSLLPLDMLRRRY